MKRHDDLNPDGEAASKKIKVDDSICKKSLQWNKWKEENLRYFIAETAETPSDLSTELLRHQKEFLAWALKQEVTYGGGILADEKGTGKTIQAISLVLSNRSHHEKKSVGTLVICADANAVTHWLNEITWFTSPGSTKVLKYHGKNRANDASEFHNYDFVLATVDTVLEDYEMEQDKQLLHSLNWSRMILDDVILDEISKPQKSKQWDAVLCLNATYRWVLTRTPIQDDVSENDLKLLVCLLRIWPYAYHFCEKCAFVYHFCNRCNCNCLRSFFWWDKYVPDDDPNTMLKRILESVQLSRKSRISLPPIYIYSRHDTLQEKEAVYYNIEYNKSREMIRRNILDGKPMEKYLDVLNNLREVVDVPDQKLRIGGKLNKDDPFQTSTKIEALRAEIMSMLETDVSAKAVVFSYFTNFLDLIKEVIEKCGLTCLKVTGDMKKDVKDEVMKKFRKEHDCKILLMSLKKAEMDVYDLTVASHVFMMDPWLNPAAEKQARDNIHRIGQYKPVRIVRFIIKNSVEEMLVRLQDNKGNVYEGDVDDLTEGDVKLLFGF